MPPKGPFYDGGVVQLEQPHTVAETDLLPGPRHGGRLHQGQAFRGKKAVMAVPRDQRQLSQRFRRQEETARGQQVVALRVGLVQRNGRSHTLFRVKAALPGQDAPAVRHGLSFQCAQVESGLYAQRLEQVFLRQLLEALVKALFQQAADQPGGKIAVSELKTRQGC